MNRTAEFVLGLIGGIFGIIGAIMGILMGGAMSALGADSGSSISSSAIIALLVAILGIVGAILAKNKTKLAGIFMVVSAVVGFICIFVFYILPGILLIIAGIMCLVRKDTSVKIS